MDIVLDYKKNDTNLFIGIFNILSFIKWKNIILMKYHFDSNTKYVGNDGYYHYKAFGIGKFIKTDFFQRLPLLMKFNLRKKFFGISSEYCDGNKFYEPYFYYKKFKIGFVPTTKNIVFGYNSNYFNFEVSNSLKYSSKFVTLNISFNY